MATARRVLRLILTNGLLLLACVIFASGFFPYKPFIPGLASYEQLGENYQAPPALFDKVIFMVVDALRSDFVFAHDSGFTFTQSLIQNGGALPFTSHAAAPTVTMPRVKAITTGSIPSFLDMILNFAESDKSSSLATQDTWLAQMRAKPNGKLVMYGDDTWLKLFPDFFARADGTSSFFVSDFTEVDNNVTRHVPEELDNHDWNAMIMHYLGMDHIGHKGGPRSVNMLPKQKEMDGIVKQVYTAIETKPHLETTLFVMCGDHGMNDNGNHGGSAPGETSPALVLMSPKFKQISRGYSSPVNASTEFEYYSVVEQSDIAATLAGLLGFPTPLNNLGIFIPDVLQMWNDEKHRERILLGNALQIRNIAKATYPHSIYEDPVTHFDCTGSLSDTLTLACAWKTASDKLHSSSESQSSSDSLILALSNFCTKAQALLSSTASNYNDGRLYNGIFIALGVTIVCVVAAWPALGLPRSASGLCLIAGAIIYIIMMFASSYVEEEQQFWYWTASIWMTVQFLHLYPRVLAFPSNMLLQGLALLRVLRRWNQSGQKWQGASDIAKAVQMVPVVLLWPPVLMTLQKAASEIATRSFVSSGLSFSVASIAATTLCLSILLLKITHTYQHERWLLPGADSLTYWLGGAGSEMLAQLVFSWLLLSATYVLVVGKTTGKHLRMQRDGQEDMLASMLLPIQVLLLVVQTTVSNIPVFLLFQHQVDLLRSLPLSQTALTVTTITMAHASFFAMGNTNAINSIDLSNAYNGITSYNPAPVGILLFLSNWAGPIFWSFSGLVLVLEKGKKQAAMKSRARLEAHNLQNPSQSAVPTGKVTTTTTAKMISSGHSATTKRIQSTSQKGNLKSNKTNQASKDERVVAPGSDERNTNDKNTPLNQPSVTSPTLAATAPLATSTTSTALALNHPQAQRDSERQGAIDGWLSHAEMLTLWSAVEICAVLAACTVLKTHLFVWTVFSPKFLYVAAWFVGWHVWCNLILGGFMAYVQ